MPTSAASAVLATSRYDALRGPPRMPVLGNALQIKPEIFHQQLEEWARVYGPRFRFQITSRKFMAITEPDAIASVLKRRPGMFVKAPRLVQVARDLGFPGVFTANGEDWAKQRQLVMAGLDPAHLRTYLPAIVEVTQRLKSKWQEKAATGQDIDLLADLMRYTVDVTTCLAFGHDLRTLDQGDGVAIQQHLNHIFPTLFKRTLAPVDVRHWAPSRETRRHVIALRQAVNGFIALARAQLASDPALRDKPANLIQALVAAHDGDSGLSDDALSGNVLTMLLAGEDTTANTLAWLIWLMSQNPSALARARAEVDAVIGAGQIAQGLAQLTSLDFVDACANEAMRLKPVAPLIILRADADAQVDGVQVPKGTFIVCLMRPAGMAQERFSRPHEFLPTRWLQGDASAGDAAGASAPAARMFGAKRVVMPFGAGPRVCPGRYLALAEIKMVMGMLLSSFDLAQVWCADGEPPERLMFTMAPVGLRMRLQAR
ncbi:MAG TPA: cytochrome P450 [Ramlibacter sp.]|nr:cytochrome P450 [Ramlibacter sp.]